MARIQGSLKLSSNIEPRMGAPLDARAVVPELADLTTASNFEYTYIGMIVSVQATHEVYMLKAEPATTQSNWIKLATGGDTDNFYTKDEIDEGWYNKEQVDQLIVKLYKPAGSATLLTLPDLANDGADVLGNVYNMSEAFETTSDFVEGSGKTYPVGTNVVVVDVGNYTEVTPEAGDNPSTLGWYEVVSGEYVLSTDTEVDGSKTYYTYTADYKFDVLPGFIDLSPYQVKIQVAELPVASEDEEGKVYQYIGTTTGSLTNGFFYICQEVSPATDPKTYEWVEKPVQSSDGGGSLSDVLTATIDAGGIVTGASYAAGTSMETLWRDLLNPLANPTLTGPSATLNTLADKLLEVGDSITATLTAVFNRGSISPAYGTDGYRAGEAETYALNGGTPGTSAEFTGITVDGEHNSFTVTVEYAAGTQPKNSRGGNYDSPLAAGSVTSPALVFEFVNALWANTASISTVAKLALVSKSAKVKEFNFPAATATNPEIFDVPASWTVTAVEVYNTLSGVWEDCASEFSITDTTHDDASSTSTAYKRYTNNLGYGMASRKIRVKWS